MILLGPLPSSFAAASLCVTFLLLAFSAREQAERAVAYAIVTFCFLILALGEGTILLGIPFWWNYFLLPLAGAFILAARLSGSHPAFTKHSRVAVPLLTFGVILAVYMACRPWIEDSLRRGAIHVDVLQYALPEALGLVRFGPLNVTGEYPSYFFGWELIGLHFIPCCSSQVFGCLTALPFVAFVGCGLPRSTLLSMTLGAATLVVTVMTFIPGHNLFTKNDLATALFLGLGVVFAYRFLRGEDPTDLHFSAMSLVLASSMKPPAMLVSAVAFCFLFFAAPSHRRRIIVLGCAGAILLAFWVFRYYNFRDYSPFLHAITRNSALFRVAPRLSAERFMVEPSMFLLGMAVGVGAGLIIALFCWLQSLGRVAGDGRKVRSMLFLPVIALATFGSLLLSPYVILLMPETKTSWLQLRLAYPLVFVILATVLVILDGDPREGGREAASTHRPLRLAFSYGLNAAVVITVIGLFVQSSRQRAVMTGNEITVRGTPTKVYELFSRVRGKSIFNVGLINAGLLGRDFSNRVKMARPEDVIALEGRSADEVASYVGEKLALFDFVALAQSRRGSIALDVEGILQQAHPQAKKVFAEEEVVVFTTQSSEAPGP
jgi:hypothetical protein